MKTLSNEQEQNADAFGLTFESIAKVEKSTGWHYDQHTHGGDIRFYVQRVSGRYEFTVWLHSSPESLIAIGIWADHDKERMQGLFHKKLGTWCPQGMTSDGYFGKGRNPERGHVGDWRTKIKAKDFLKNFNTIRKLVDEIEAKLKETGLQDELRKL